MTVIQPPHCFSDKILMLLRDVSPSAASGQTLAIAHHASHTSLLFKRMEIYSKRQIIQNYCAWVFAICYTCFYWVLIIFLPQKNMFPRQFFSRPSRIKSSQNQLNLFITGRYVQAPVRLSRRSHSDVYFSLQVYLTLKPQNNLFICPAVAKVHNNTPGEPLCPLSRDAVVGSIWRLQPKKGNDNNVLELKWAEATGRSKLIVFPNLSAAICEY